MDTVESHHSELDGAGKIFRFSGNFLVMKTNNGTWWQIKNFSFKNILIADCELS